MKVTVTGKNMAIGESLTNYVEEELNLRIKKYFEDAVSAGVVFTKERSNIVVDIIVNEGTGNNVVIKSRSEAGDPRSAFVSSAEKIDKQLRRYKRKIKDHKSKKSNKETVIDFASATKYVLSSKEEDDHKEDENNQSPLIIAEKPTQVQELTVSDAVMLMDLSELPALMFINRRTGDVNVVYKRVDGNISWVESGVVSKKNDVA